MKYRKALEQIAESFVDINYDKLSILEEKILREATVALSWSVVVKGLQRGDKDHEIALEKFSNPGKTMNPKPKKMKKAIDLLVPHRPWDKILGGNP